MAPSWTLLGLPSLTRQPGQGPTTAAALLQEIATQGGARSKVHRWRPGTQTWEGHALKLSFGDFSLAGDEGYLVRCSQPSTYVPRRGDLLRGE